MKSVRAFAPGNGEPPGQFTAKNDFTPPVMDSTPIKNGAA